MAKQIADAIAQQKVTFFKLALNAGPLAGRNVLAEDVDGLLTADNPFLNQLTGFVLKEIHRVLNGLEHDFDLCARTIETS
jgi:hypothetical protein